MGREEAQRLAGRSLPADLFGQWNLLSRQLLRWNAMHRLTGHRDSESAYGDLFLDSLALVPLVRGDTLLDIGSGAGFPGLVLALALPRLRVTLLESRAKKVSFQKHAIRVLGLQDRVRAVQGRAGQDLMEEGFDTVTMRAVGGLSESINLGRPYVKSGGVLLLPRGTRDRQDALGLNLDVHAYCLPDKKEPRIIVSCRL